MSEENTKESFEEISRRLQEIADQVQDEDASLETSIDLLEEAVKLGTKATDLIDDEHLSDEEKARLQELVNDEVEEDQEIVGEKVDEEGLQEEAQEAEVLAGGADGEEATDAADAEEATDAADGEGAASDAEESAASEEGYIPADDIALHEAETDADDGKWTPDV